MGLSPQGILGIIAIYFLGIFLISHVTARGATLSTFFTANKKSPWLVVAYGMIGTTLTGVTFVSLPGWVGVNSFSYFQTTMGYVLGYAIIATVLIPLYYKLNLISIYTYLEGRFGFWSYKTGAFFFLLSRSIQASAKIFVMAVVLQTFIFKEIGVPFTTSVIIIVALIWLYTFRGGINTIVWTDLLQTTFMLLAAGLTIYLIGEKLQLGMSEMFEMVQERGDLSKAFFWDPMDKRYFFKQFFSGAFLALVMTGLDQDMMQKNLTCKSTEDAQKNMFWFSMFLVFVNMLFMTLGGILYLFIEKMGIQAPASTDELFPMIAKNYLGTAGVIAFILGIISATYSSADSALTSLTTSFCVDFLDFNKTKTGEAKKRMRRIQVHLMFSVILVIVVLIFKLINNESALDTVLRVAGYTYGPLLGLFSFGLATKRAVNDRLVPLIAAISPLTCWILDFYSEEWFYGYHFGYELLMLNGLITFIGLWIISSKKEKTNA